MCMPKLKTYFKSFIKLDNDMQWKYYFHSHCNPLAAFKKPRELAVSSRRATISHPPVHFT